MNYISVTTRCGHHHTRFAKKEKREATQEKAALNGLKIPDYRKHQGDDANKHIPGILFKFWQFIWAEFEPH